MDNEFDFDLDLDVDPNASPEQAFGVPADASASQGRTARPPKTGKGFPKAVIAAAAAVAVLVGGFFGMRAIAGSGGKGGKGLAANETVAFLSDVVKNGSLSAELGLKKITGYDGTVSVELKSDLSSAKKACASVDAALNLKKTQVADISVYLGTDRLVVSSDALLAGKSLGVDLARLSEDLDGSMFDPDSNSFLAMDEDAFAALKDSLSGDVGPDAEKLYKQMKAVYEDGCQALGKSVKAHADKEKSSDELSFGEKTVKVNVVTYTADAEAAYAITMDILQWARDSKELKTLLKLLQDDYPALLEQANLEDYVEDFYDKLDDAISDLKEDKDDFLDENEDMKLELSLYSSKGKKELLGLKLRAKANRNDVKAEAFWGPTLADMSDISFKYDDGYQKYSGSYSVKTNDKQSFESALKLKRNSSNYLDASFKCNRQDGSFTLKAADLTIKGTLEKLSDGFQAKVSKVTMYGGEVKIDLTLTLRRSAKVSAPSSYENVITMDEDDLEDLLYDLQDAAEDLIDSNEDLAELLYDLIPRRYLPGYYW